MSSYHLIAATGVLDTKLDIALVVDRAGVGELVGLNNEIYIYMSLVLHTKISLKQSGL
jgi:hypothetical protein